MNHVRVCTRCYGTDFVRTGGTGSRCRTCHARKTDMLKSTSGISSSTLDRGSRDYVPPRPFDHSKCKPWTDTCCGECLWIYSQVREENTEKAIA